MKQRLDVAMAERSTFFEDAIAAYGYDEARLLGQTIISSLQASQDRLPLIKPISGINPIVYFSEEQYTVQGFAQSKAGIIELAVAPDAECATLMQEIPYVIEHEAAHIAHAQRNPDLWDYNKIAEVFLLAAALKEGVARHAEYHLDEEYEPGMVFNYSTSLVDKIMRVLADVVYEPGANQKEQHYEFLFGEDVFPERGYVVGHYVVACMAAIRGNSLAELMELPLEEYAYFIGVDL